MDASPERLALSFAVAAIAGALVGLEREPRSAGNAPRFAGIRTFPLFSLFGALCGLLATAWGSVVIAVGMGVQGMLLALAYFGGQQRLEGPDRPGLTSEAAAMVVFLLGALPFAEGTGLSYETRVLATVAGGAVLTGILAFRSPLHRFARAVDAADMKATVQFVLLAVVALPLVPDVAMGPYEALNPHTITTVVVLVAGISFVGYVAVRLLGPSRGIGLVGLFGGLVSSTAVTLTFSGRGRQTPALASACAMAIVLASGVMFPRVLVELAVVDPALVAPAAPAQAAMGVVGLLAVAVLWTRQRGESTGEGEVPEFANPFSLGEAFKMGAAFAVVLVIAAAAQARFGDAGIYISAGAAGLTDVDAIVLSMADLHRNSELEARVAVRAITLATVVNTLVKAGMAVVLGGPRVGRPVALALGLAATTGVVVALMTV